MKNFKPDVRDAAGRRNGNQRRKNRMKNFKPDIQDAAVGENGKQRRIDHE